MRLRRLIVTTLLTCAAVAGACVVGFYLTDRDGWNKRAFERIAPGMPRADLERALGEPADCVISVGQAEAWFYRGALGTVACERRVNRLADLPTLYGTLQILVGPDERVRAVSMDGERPLKTLAGQQFASVLNLLPESAGE